MFLKGEREKERERGERREEKGERRERNFWHGGRDTRLGERLDMRRGKSLLLLHL